ncbi:DUF881 domain-containing protein [Microlunatus sp. Gsoil 973]|uniref:DUF881 domain-containing protein n=1 Tax=Microlunatus sp. Gsoil 973 TaxID=2672569 RepID=UPI0012B4A7E1|nr:DUF881 domain-containing protein [Microlunatus sp. Gsoil 973]QGN32781.1 DUF881 domain-containing protein [Microlunatus sp. Gsoil 973]
MGQATRTRDQRSPRALDASMDLLKQIAEHPIDPDYAVVAAREADRRKRHSTSSRVAFAVIAVIVGTLFTVAALQTTRSRPVVAKERDQLVARIKTAEANRARLRDEENELAAENARLRSTGLGNDAQAERLRTHLSDLESRTGAAAVTGPGLKIIVDDGTGQSQSGAQVSNQVLDVDLQVLVNGLWTAGAEAIQINGQRLTALTAIREAGQAITVNYRSLTPPYEVDAIGSPQTLQARLLETSAGPWWNALKENQGMRYDVSPADQLRLNGVPGLTVRTGRTR